MRGKYSSKGRRFNKNLVLALISIVLCAALYITGYFDLKLEEGEIEVHYIDVGQGDAALILTEAGSVLIDAGTTESGERVAAYVKSRTDTLDYMILSHPHEDHIGGSYAVFDDVKVLNIIMPDTTADTTSFDRTLNGIEESGASVYPAKKGDTYEIGGLKLEILSPAAGAEYEEVNNVSAVVRAEYGMTSFLFTGDAEKLVEDELIEGGADLDVDVLKVGHHGSSTSSSEEFIKRVSPQIAVISCGKGNTYGHPHGKVTDRLEKYGAEIFRTDRKGDIVIASDGMSVYAK